MSLRVAEKVTEEVEYGDESECDVVEIDKNSCRTSNTPMAIRFARKADVTAPMLGNKAGSGKLRKQVFCGEAGFYANLLVVFYAKVHR